MTSSLTFDENEYVALLPEHHPLAARETLTLGELRNEKFVFGTGDSWAIFRKQVFSECRKRDFFPDISLEATNSDGIFGLVIAGAGVAIYSSCIGKRPRQGLAVRRLSDLSEKLPITAVWGARNKSAELETFLVSCGAVRARSRPRNCRRRPRLESPRVAPPPALRPKGPASALRRIGRPLPRPGTEHCSRSVGRGGARAPSSLGDRRKTKPSPLGIRNKILCR